MSNFLGQHNHDECTDRKPYTTEESFGCLTPQNTVEYIDTYHGDTNRGNMHSQTSIRNNSSSQITPPMQWRHGLRKPQRKVSYKISNFYEETRCLDEENTEFSPFEDSASPQISPPVNMGQGFKKALRNSGKDETSCSNEKDCNIYKKTDNCNYNLKSDPSLEVSLKKKVIPYERKFNIFKNNVLTAFHNLSLNTYELERYKKFHECEKLDKPNLSQKSLNQEDKYNISKSKSLQFSEHQPQKSPDGSNKKGLIWGKNNSFLDYIPPTSSNVSLSGSRSEHYSPKSPGLPNLSFYKRGLHWKKESSLGHTSSQQMNELKQHYSQQQIPTHQESDQQIPTHQGSDQQIPTHQGSDQQIPTHQGSDQQIPTHQGSDQQIPTHQGSDQLPIAKKSLSSEENVTISDNTHFSQGSCSVTKKTSRNSKCQDGTISPLIKKSVHWEEKDSISEHVSLISRTN